MRLLELVGHLLQGASAAEQVGAGRIVAGGSTCMRRTESRMPPSLFTPSHCGFAGAASNNLRILDETSRAK
jgi:hypothetical protein